MLKLLLALPFVDWLVRLGSKEAIAATPLKVARVSDLKQPWDSARFMYRVKVKTKDVYKQEVVTEEAVPGLVIRLPDELADKGGRRYQGEVLCG